ncbi:winged helix-turn-helix transcriptional regulator [Candidatus Woesebacteria bacterium]|nr:winged helix-turn-helix transcriptional regulator [Candidatus Woesebacteria bacterium]
MNTLQDLMISRVRVKMLELFLTNQKELYYVRDISRQIKEEINAVRRELERLSMTGLLKSEQRGNRLYYFLNPKYIFFQELERMIAKTTGLGKKLRKLQNKLGSIDFVMFSSRFVRGLPPAQGQLDILLIGDIVLQDLTDLIKEDEKARGREINYTVFSKDEFEFRKQRRDPFIMDVLFAARVMVIGSEDEFVERKPPQI